MMRLPSPRSFGGKLLVLTLLATSAGVIIQSGVMRLIEVLEIKPSALAELTIDADVIAMHGAAALAFHDPYAARETLAALEVTPRILAARMFDDQGALFASYERDGQSPAAEPAMDGHRFENERLLLGRAIAYDGEALGSLLIVYDLSDYYGDIRRNVMISIVIGVLAVGIAMLAARRLGRALARPVNELVRASRRIAEVRNYALRVPRFNDDELGELTDSFNAMLGTIETRDAALIAAQRALKASNDQLQQFAYVASHDLQEPLRKIQTFASLLVDDHASGLPEEAQDYLARMDAAATRMRSLITDLLAYSRVSSKEPVLRDIDLNVIVQEVLSDLEIRIQDTCGSVQVDQLPVVRADELHMRQLFQNLIGNALKFHRPDVPPIVRVRAARAKDGGGGEELWRVSIEDNGVGFEQQYADRIFMPFQRLHGRDAYEGTGMGLAVCRRIADRYDWELTVESQLGEGTAFHMTVPAHRVESIATSPDGRGSSPEAHHERNHAKTLDHHPDGGRRRRRPDDHSKSAGAKPARQRFAFRR